MILELWENTHLIPTALVQALSETSSMEIEAEVAHNVRLIGQTDHNKSTKNRIPFKKEGVELRILMGLFESMEFKENEWKRDFARKFMVLLGFYYYGMIKNRFSYRLWQECKKIHKTAKQGSVQGCPYPQEYPLLQQQQSIPRTASTSVPTRDVPSIVDRSDSVNLHPQQIDGMNRGQLIPPRRQSNLPYIDSYPTTLGRGNAGEGYHRQHQQQQPTKDDCQLPMRQPVLPTCNLSRLVMM